MSDEREIGLSKHLASIWGHLRINHLILATTEFIVYLDDELDIEWKTSEEWDRKHAGETKIHRSLFNQVAELEAADWDYSDLKRTRNFKRQLAEVLACCFVNDYDNANSMLDRVKEYRISILNDREKAIEDQLAAKADWKKSSEIWTILHYSIGIAALFLSTLVAARPSIFGLNETAFQSAAWLLAFLTGL